MDVAADRENSAEAVSLMVRALIEDDVILIDDEDDEDKELELRHWDAL